MIPFLADKNDFKVGEYIFVENVRAKIINGDKEFKAIVFGDKKREITLKLDALTDSEKQIILKGCLINFYKK